MAKKASVPLIAKAAAQSRADGRIAGNGAPGAETAVAPKLSQGGMAIVAVAVLVVMVIFSSQALKPQLDNPVFLAREGKLAKVATLGVIPGESYGYAFSVGNASANLTFLVMGGNGCTVISLAEGRASVCVDEHGNDQGMQNTTYLVPAIILTKPWMLAVTDGWIWNVSSYMVFGNITKHIVDTNYTAIRKEYYKGRQAYVVRIDSTEGDHITDWVDSEKRILLREIGPGYEVDIISGVQLEG